MKKYLIFFLTVLLVTAEGCTGETANQKKALLDTAEKVKQERTDTSNSTNNSKIMNKITIAVGSKILTATLADNSSVDALLEELAKGDITIKMQDYGNFEKVGDFGRSFPRNDEQITTEPGDLILYQGSAFVIYYAPNSWSFTPLGKIDNISQAELKAILGKGDVTVVLSLL